MPAEETSQSQEEQTSQQAAEALSGENTGTQGGEQESTSLATESLTPEQIQQTLKDYQEAQRKITEQGQEAAALRAQLEAREAENAQFRSALSSFGQQAQAQLDEEQAALQRLRDAGYDEEARTSAMLDLIDARNKKREQRLFHQFTQYAQMQQEIPDVARAYGTHDQTVIAQNLQRARENLTPKALVAADLFVRSPEKLVEWLEQDKAARRQKAKQAELLASLDQGAAAGGRIPGSLQPSPVKKIYWEHWAALNPAAKKRFRDSDEQFEVVGAPKDFDPNKD